MNNPISEPKVEAAKHSFRIQTLLNKLRDKLKNFSVLDNRGQLVGEVRNVKLDTDRQISLVIHNTDPFKGSRFFLIRSKHIQQVDSVSKSLFVDLSKLEIDHLENYQPPVSSEINQSEQFLDSPPVIDHNTSLERDNSPYKTMNTDATIPSEEYLEVPDVEASPDTQVVEEEFIRLLEERLVVDRTKRKVGEVIVRKEVETRMVEVPIRYEKLIVEQISPEYKQLAEFNLGEGEVTGVDFSETTQAPLLNSAGEDAKPTVRGEFSSPKTASLFLNAIALERQHGCSKVRVELVLEDAELQKTYQEWFNRCSGS
jgi:sporulation protein YlmC with PRC-barrel domain